MSYRSKHPFKVVGEITIWQGHSPEQIKEMKDDWQNSGTRVSKQLKIDLG
jgi:hypothetical protein